MASQALREAAGEGQPTVAATGTPDLPAAAKSPAGPRMLRVPPPPPPPPVPTREQLLAALDTIQPGASRDQVFAKLGQPAYSIGMPEGGHMIERCRFRLGSENLASIEFNDGIATVIDRRPH
jgi:hypothetical protein